MPIEYEVQQGDSIAKIAFRYGLHPDTIWNFPDNQKLKLERKDPYVLLPGDIVVIPDKRIVQYPRATEQRHRFQRKGVPETLRVQIWCLGEPAKNMGYLIDLDGHVERGTTDGSGMLIHPVPPNLESAEVTLDNGMMFTLAIGYLDPIDTLVGIKKRLKNVGFFSGELDDEQGPDFVEAIEKFQADQDLPVTGDMDAATKQKLKEVFEG